MPALNPEVIESLMNARAEFDVVRFADYILPFRLKADITTIEIIEKILLEGEYYSLSAFQHRLIMKVLPTSIEDAASFININTPEEWQCYQQRL
jgi:molybdopterin-guanine dinucleotide biosynthesis protein A